MPVFGLHTSGSHASYISEKTRRRVLYQYPQGPAPLTYFLSLLPDEETDKTEFGWWEERDTVIKSTTVTSGSLGSGGAGPFTNAALTTSQAAAGFNVAANTEYGLFVADASVFAVQDVIWIRNVPNGAASASLNVRGVVTAVDANANTLKFRALEAVTSVSNDTDANSITVYFTSKAAAEGTKSKSSNYTFPIEISNYTQILKHGIHITRSALKQGVRYDSSGVWQDKMKKVGLRHMKAMEMTTLRGTRLTRNTTNEDGDTVPERFTGGLEYFLRQWEVGNTANSGIADYRPGGTDISASAWNASDDKRILDIQGTVTMDQFESILENAFRYTSETSFEKLCVCGSGFLRAVQQYARNQSLILRDLNPKTDTFGQTQMYRLETIYGTLVFKSHPLLTQDATFRNDAYIVDLPCFKWRPLLDSDTEFLTGRQDNDFDGRKDSWLTEGGYEINFPENHMYIKNLTGITI